MLRLTLRYADINSLFEKPDDSPFSEDFLEYGTVAGVEYIYNESQANPALKRVETTIVLPREQITPDLERSTREALRRYCLASAVGRWVRASVPCDGGLYGRSQSRSCSSSSTFYCSGSCKTSTYWPSRLSSKAWTS